MKIRAIFWTVISFVGLTEAILSNPPAWAGWLVVFYIATLATLEIKLSQLLPQTKASTDYQKNAKNAPTPNESDKV